jgi:hypothetical protein
MNSFKKNFFLVWDILNTKFSIKYLFINLKYCKKIKLNTFEKSIEYKLIQKEMFFWSGIF